MHVQREDRFEELTGAVHGQREDSFEELTGAVHGQREDSLEKLTGAVHGQREDSWATWRCSHDRRVRSLTPTSRKAQIKQRHLHHYFLILIYIFFMQILINIQMLLKNHSLAGIQLVYNSSTTLPWFIRVMQGIPLLLNRCLVNIRSNQQFILVRYKLLR